jgi:hypothetical protein
MKKLILVLTAFLFSLSALAEGDMINNGGGLAEKNILFAMEKMNTYLSSCLASEFCRLDSQQKEVLQKIQQGLPAESQNPSLIQFKSELENPGFFVIDNEPKVAKTGDAPASPIYVNIDMIYSKDSAGRTVPVSIPDAVAILVHELGHHYGVASHEFLDLLGVKVGMFISLQTYTTSPLPFLPNFSVSAFNADADYSSSPEIVLSSDDRSVDLTKDLLKASYCVFNSYPNNSDTDISKPLGSFIYNLHWSTIKHNSHSADLYMMALLTHKCQNPYRPNEAPAKQEYKIRIRIKVDILTNTPAVTYVIKQIITEQVSVSDH